MQVIKSNTWKENSMCIVKRGMGGHIYQLRLKPKDSYPVAIEIVAMLVFVALAFIPVLGWVGCYLIYKHVFKKSESKVKLSELKHVELLTGENQKSMASKTGWALAGGLAFGPAGVMAGALAKGEVQKSSAILTFTNDRKAVVTGDFKDINELLLQSIEL